MRPVFQLSLVEYLPVEINSSADIVQQLTARVSIPTIFNVARRILVNVGRAGRVELASRTTPSYRFSLA